MRKSDVFNYALRHAAIPAERHRFAERARYFFDQSVRTLRRSSTHHLARPVVVLLTSGWLQAWFEQHARATAPRAALPRAGFGPPVAFEPQRERARRRARLGGMVAGIAAAAAAAGAAIGLGLLLLHPLL